MEKPKLGFRERAQLDLQISRAKEILSHREDTYIYCSTVTSPVDTVEMDVIRKEAFPYLTE